MKAIGSPLDFVGLNIYTPQYVRADESAKGWALEENPTSYPHMASPWLTIGPECIYWGVRNVTDLWKPKGIYITENGCSSDDVLTPVGRVEDTDRVMYLRNHLTQLHRAAVEGYPIKGYFLWSLLDNFEWATAYALLTSKGELKLAQAAENPENPDPAGPGAVLPLGGGSVRITDDAGGRGGTLTGPRTGPVRMARGADGSVRIEAPRILLAGLADLLTQLLRQPVIDATGLEGATRQSLKYREPAGPLRSRSPARQRPPIQSRTRFFSRCED